MRRAIVGLGSCGLAAGGARVFEALGPAARALGLDLTVGRTGCLGLCFREPLVRLESPALGAVLYGDVTPEVVPGLLRAHFLEARALPAHVVDPALLAREHRVVLRNCGRIDPDSLDAYRAAGGYVALARALHELSPEQVVAEIEASGLRGRGGGGFPTGRKWALARAATGEPKTVICNADEGDPGAFMDRNIVEGDPFSVLEGMTIAAWAIGATQGVIYVREEYPLAVDRLVRTVDAARAAGLLGRGVLGSRLDFDVQVKRGAGAFVCGEETALIASLEGHRGTPRLRPPFPVEQGLAGRPTVINNVETFANVPRILAHGPAELARLGHGDSRGTKVFSLAGDVKRTGMVEVPMGVTLREVLFDLGGGSRTGRPLKAVQIGGPSGGCLPVALFDTPIEYESLLRTGAIMGSGGLVAMDTGSCMVDVARYFLRFTQLESCGKCTFCRLGTLRMRQILDRVCTGGGRPGDLDLLETLAQQVRAHSLCGLGRSAPNPVLTTLRYFRAEYEAHVHQGCCPAGKCRDLITFSIDPCVCDGCTLCFEQCPATAISKQTRAVPLAIDESVCVRCGGCREVCQFGAVAVR